MPAMATHTVRRVGVASVVKVVAFVYAVVGLIIGGLLSIASLAGAALGSMAGGDDGAAGTVIGLLFGVGAVIILPIFYAALGAIGGLIAGLAYNVVASAVGGIKLDLEADGPA